MLDTQSFLQDCWHKYKAGLKHRHSTNKSCLEHANVCFYHHYITAYAQKHTVQNQTDPENDIEII